MVSLGRELSSLAERTGLEAQAPRAWLGRKEEASVTCWKGEQGFQAPQALQATGRAIRCPGSQSYSVTSCPFCPPLLG